eukprot:4659258-Amphidinium_carterae.7
MEDKLVTIWSEETAHDEIVNVMNTHSNGAKCKHCAPREQYEVQAACCSAIRSDNLYTDTPHLGTAATKCRGFSCDSTLDANTRMHHLRIVHSMNIGHM